jgi:hypothetical protein
VSVSNIRYHFLGRHVYHPYDEKYIFLRSATFDTLAKYVLLEEDMYFNRRTFSSSLGHPFQFTVIKQRSSAYKSSGKLFNQIDDQIQEE